MMNETINKADYTLKTYLNNAKNAVFLVEVNQESVKHRVLDMLKNDFDFEIIDFECVRDTFVNSLRNFMSTSKDKHICIWNFSENFETYDIIKSLNISRDILKEIGIVVFIMPTFLVRQIDERELNLRDYVLKKFVYVEHKKNPFDPLYVISLSSEYARQNGEAIDAVFVKSIMDSENELQRKVQIYYDLLYSYLKRRLSPYDYIQLYDLFLKICNLLEQYPAAGKEAKRDQERTKLAIICNTAEVIATQKYFKEAEAMFDEILSKEASNGKWEMYLLKAKEGQAYCLYRQNKFQEAGNALLSLLCVLEEKRTVNDSWKMNITNNYGACLYKMGKYEQAYERWCVCEDMLASLNLLDEKRRLRCEYNKMIANIEFCDISLEKTEQYYSIYSKIGETFGAESIQYIQHSLLYIWLIGVIYGKTREALLSGSKLLDLEKQILDGNSYQIALSHYINYVLYGQLGEEDSAMESLEKCRKIMKSNIITNESLPEILKELGFFKSPY